MSTTILDNAWQELDQLLSKDFSQDWRKEKQNVLERVVREGLLRIAVLGRFKAGKSTLINALIGQELLPADALPATAVICEIEKGEPERYYIQQSGQQNDIDRDQFQRYATGQQGQCELIVVRATLPGIPLPERVCLADTPGVDDLNEDHARVAYGYLPQVDAALYVLRATQGGLSQGDLDYLKQGILSSTRENLLFVITHVDQLSDTQLGKVLEAVKSHLQGVGILQPVILPINSIHAMDAHAENESDPELETVWQALKTHHLDHVDKLRQRRAWRIWHGILESSQHQIEIQRQGLQFNDADLQKNIESLYQAQVDLQSRRDALEKIIAQRELQLMDQLGIHVRKRLQIVAVQAAALVKARAQSPRSGSGQHLAADIRNQLADQMNQLLEQWLRPELASIQNEIQGEVKRFAIELPSLQDINIELGGQGWRGHLLDVFSQVLVFGAIDLVLPGGHVAALIARMLGQKVFGNAAEKVTSILTKVINATTVEVLASQVKSSILERESDIVQQFQNQLEPVLQEMVNNALSQADAQINEARAALEKARESQQMGQRQVASEQRRLEQLASQLSSLDAAHNVYRH